MTLRVWLFVLFVLKWAVPIVACTFVVLAALNVSDNLTDCRLSHEAAKIYIKDNCHVGENMNRKGIMLECKRRFDIRDRETPASCAWRAWVEDLVGCTSRSCIESLRVSTWTFVSWFAAILVFLLAAYMFLDRWLARGTAELYNQQRIPSTYDVDDTKMH